MSTDFDNFPDRTGTGSLKWDTRASVCGDDSVLPMWVADMDFACPRAIVEAVKARADHPIYGYPVRTEGYYSSLINWMKKRNDWDIQKEWICYSPGVVPAINFCVLAYSQPGDKIIVQTPVYYPFSSAVLNNGRQLVENQLRLDGDHYVIDFEDLERKIDARTKMIIFCSPHNPVGRVWKREELERLVEICKKKGILIISDEIHSDLIIGSIRHTCIATLPGAADITVTLTAPNKTFNIAGLTTANAIISDKRLRDAFMAVTGNIGLGISNVFGIVAQEAAYTHGEPWLEELLEYLRENYRTLADFVTARLPELSVLPLEGTYLAWLDCRKLGMNDAELKEFFLKKAKLWLDEGTMFGNGGAGFMRINIACPKRLLTEALIRIENALIENRR